MFLLAMFGAGRIELLIVVVVIVVPFWKIFNKAGYPASLSLLMTVPLVNVILLYYLAFASWPALVAHPTNLAGEGQDQWPKANG